MMGAGRGLITVAAFALAASLMLCTVVPSHGQEPAATPQQDSVPAGLLAASCANCHGYEGRGAWPIAAIAGRPYAELHRQLIAFREGDTAVDATVMGRLMAGYSDRDIEALASWFASLPATAAGDTAP